MNPDLLLTHFNRVSNDPDAVQRLRRFILDLGVRGKLVEQKPTDESAAKLITRIAAATSQSGKSKGIIKPVLVGVNDAPFDIPSNWAWVRLGAICLKTGSGSTPRGGKSVYQRNGVPFLRSQNVHDDGLRLDDVAYISPQTHEKMSGTAVEPGDLLLNITGGSIGRCCLVQNGLGRANVSQHVAIIRPAIDGIQRYLHKLVLSPYFQSFVLSEQTGAGRGGLPKNRMDRILVALPPLPEQQRIVSRVDELMGLCDQLLEMQSERENQRDLLTAASHYLICNGANADAFRKHTHFFIGHLPHLTMQPDQIKPLRQTILNLAVRGQLVPQDSNDEPLSGLLGRIQAEKEDLIGARALEREYGESRLSNEEIPFDLPSSWQWVPLQSVIVFGPQNGISPKPSSRPDAPRAVTLTATTKGTFDSRYFKHVDATIPRDSEFWLRPGDLLFQRGNTREYVGMAAYYSGEPGLFLYPDLMIKVRLSEKVSLRYVHLCAVAPHARTYFSAHASGAQATMPKINQGVLVKLPIPLAPFAEQNRIVAKVDELMRLCDHLESQLTTTRSESQRLLETVLYHALNKESREIDKKFAVQS
jgi:type I restriction enzyme S subunit